MRKYETIIVIDSLLKLEEIEGIINKYERFISANGGQVETIDRWGKRRLAYEIKKRQYGFYVLIRFNAPPAMIKQLDREYRLNEFLLRTMTTLLDKRALKALAKQFAAMPPAAAQPETPAAVPAAAEAPAAEAAVEPAAAEAPTAEAPAAEAPVEPVTAAEEVSEPVAATEPVEATPAEEAATEETPAAE